MISYVPPKNKDYIPIDVLNWNVCTRNVHQSIQSHQLQIRMQIVLDKVLLWESSLTNSNASKYDKNFPPQFCIHLVDRYFEIRTGFLNVYFLNEPVPWTDRFLNYRFFGQVPKKISCQIGNLDE